MAKTSKVSNSSLHDARAEKNDEFYTQIADVEREIGHYKAHFKGKIVFCNCDDPQESNFWKYFELKFEQLGLRKLVSTHYVREGSSYKLEMTDGQNSPRVRMTPLEGNGDFRSDESVEILKEADIVVTNPPFSLFREYINQLIVAEKRFLVIGSLNAVTYRDIFQYIKDNKLWLGSGFQGGNAYFRTPNPENFANGVYNPVTGLVKFRNVHWFTNMEHSKRNEDLVLFRQYSEDAYPKYGNYDAIEVDRLADIPADYTGIMGVPLTFLDKYNPDQFEIVGSSRTLGKRMSEIAEKGTYSQGGPRFYLPNSDGTYRRLYDRIAIRRKKKDLVTQSGEGDSQ